MMISFVNYIACKIFNRSIHLKGSRIYLSWFRIATQNVLSLTNSQVKKTRMIVNGKGNEIVFTNCQVSNSIINVTGNNNIIEVAKDVKLRKGNIIIRGNNCIVRIDEKTTFGSVRIVNVGTKNAVIIGKDCLLSDKIEIWASDSHAIYDENGLWINKEKPVIIGNCVWIGSKVTILKGVTIADGAIIGMGSVLTKNVQEKTIVAGHPAKVIKENIHWSLEYPL